MTRAGEEDNLINICSKNRTQIKYEKEKTDEKEDL